MTVLSIDPGISGSICVKDLGDEYHFFKMPIIQKGTKNIVDTKSLFNLFKQYLPDLIVLEEVHAMPGQGVTSMFSFGMSYGAVLGVIGAYQHDFESYLMLVTPQVWKRHYGLLKTSKEDVLQKVSHPKINEIKNKAFRVSFSEALLINKYGVLKYAHST